MMPVRLRMEADLMARFNAAYNGFINRYDRVPNTFLIAPDCYAALQDDLRVREWEFQRAFNAGILDVPAPRIALIGCPVLVLTHLAPGTIQAALVGE